MNFFIQREYFELICRTFISLYTEKKVQDLICNNFHSEIAVNLINKHIEVNEKIIEWKDFRLNILQ